MKPKASRKGPSKGNTAPKATKARGEDVATNAEGSTWTDSESARFRRREWSRKAWKRMGFSSSNPDDIALAVAFLCEGIAWLQSESVKAKTPAVAAHCERWPVTAFAGTSRPELPPTLGDLTPWKRKGRKAQNYLGTPANRIATATMIAAERLRELESQFPGISESMPGHPAPSVARGNVRALARWAMDLLDQYQNPEQACREVLSNARDWTPQKARSLAKELAKIGKSRTDSRAFPDTVADKREGYRERLVESLQRLIP